MAQDSKSAYGPSLSKLNHCTFCSPTVSPRRFAAFAERTGESRETDELTQATKALGRLILILYEKLEKLYGLSRYMVKV